jgi:KaiC/GvpD/RAD55 family RecA-like ATPase
LQRFDELLRSESGQAIVVVGPPGMGKTLLVNRMARCARDHPDLRCGSVRYEVTPADTVDITMSLMMDNAFDAAGIKEKSFDATPRRLQQWRALLNVVHIGRTTVLPRRQSRENSRG